MADDDARADEPSEKSEGGARSSDSWPPVVPPLERPPSAGTPTSSAWGIPTLAARLRMSPDTIRIALGCIWILDAALQFQPGMFGRGFVTQVLLPNAQGQPAPIAWAITQLSHFILPDVGVWNFLFGTLQLAIGVGLLFRRTARTALVVMMPWCVGVWVFGEGLGMLLTGTASPLTGAPGAVAIYALIGVLIWPSTRRTDAAEPSGQPRMGVASSAAARGPLGTWGALAAWSGLWILSAVLWLLPDNRAPGAVSQAISGAAAGQPGWYASFLTTFAHHFTGDGAQIAWVMALLSLVVGLGPLLSGRPGGFLALGVLVELAMWVTGRGLGGILTGMGTDPQTAPLAILLAVAMWPAVVPAVASAGSPITALWRWSPSATTGMAAAAVAAILLSATYPVAGSVAAASTSGSTTASATATSGAASGGSASQGMSGMSGVSSQSSSSASSSAKGSTMKGMSAAAMAGMAGLRVVEPNWHYTGPPLPSVETQLLTTVTNETDSGHLMQTPNCDAAPTDVQTLGAMQYVQETTAAVAKYKELSAAVAAGYVPITDPSYPVVHYVNLSYMKQKYVMDPNHVQSLVYAFTPYGPVLVAAMYLMPTVSDKGPMPYGCLVQWHAHTNLCMSASTRQYVGFTPCAAGTFNLRTPVMTHVWQVPVAPWRSILPTCRWSRPPSRRSSTGRHRWIRHRG